MQYRKTHFAFCPHCDGEGSFDSNLWDNLSGICLHCNGTGERQVPLQNILPATALIPSTQLGGA